MNDRFSLERFGLLWDFYHPRIVWQAGLSILVVVITYLFLMMCCRLGTYNLYSIGMNILLMPVFLGPLLFATYKNRELIVQIPATVSEKSVFMIIYVLAFIPAIVWLTWLSMEAICHIAGFNVDVLHHFDYRLRDIGVSKIMNLTTLFSNALPVVVSLYIILSCRTYRVLRGIIAVVVTPLAIGLVNATYWIILFYRAMPALTEGKNGFHEQIFNDFLKETMPTYMTVNAIASICLVIIGIVLVWRKVGRIQV